MIANRVIPLFMLSVAALWFLSGCGKHSEPASSVSNPIGNNPNLDDLLSPQERTVQNYVRRLEGGEFVHRSANAFMPAATHRLGLWLRELNEVGWQPSGWSAIWRRVMPAMVPLRFTIFESIGNDYDWRRDSRWSRPIAEALQNERLADFAKGLRSDLQSDLYLDRGFSLSVEEILGCFWRLGNRFEGVSARRDVNAGETSLESFAQECDLFFDSNRNPGSVRRTGRSIRWIHYAGSPAVRTTDASWVLDSTNLNSLVSEAARMISDASTNNGLAALAYSRGYLYFKTLTLLFRTVGVDEVLAR